MDLFKKVFDRYNGTALPEQIGLKNLLATEYSVVPDRITPTVRIMLDSAEQAGLFKTAGNRTRMVLPLTLPGGSTQTIPPAPRQHEAHTPGGGSSGGGGGGGGGNDDGSGIDPAILGLLRRLPPGGTPLSAKRRTALIEAFTATVGFIYPEADSED